MPSFVGIPSAGGSFVRIGTSPLSSNAAIVAIISFKLRWAFIASASSATAGPDPIPVPMSI